LGVSIHFGILFDSAKTVLQSQVNILKADDFITSEGLKLQYKVSRETTTTKDKGTKDFQRTTKVGFNLREFVVTGSHRDTRLRLHL
jgi:hypothetical protein